MSAKKAMKSMKAMKAMKSMRKMKAKRVSKIAKGKRARSAVFAGRKEKTYTGLKKSDLIKNKAGKIVTKKASQLGKKNKWAIATAAARKALKVKGFCPVGGKTAAGKALLAKARSFYKKK